jgi:hypothetical protein
VNDVCGHGHHREHGRRGFRGFGRRGGFPNREEWLERLQAYQQQLEEELRNVQDVIERLGPTGPQETANV